MASATATQDAAIRELLDRARRGQTDIVDDDTAADLVREAERDLYEGASRDEVYEALINVTTARIERDPAYKRVAAVLHLDRYFDEVTGQEPIDLLGTESEDTTDDTGTSYRDGAADYDALYRDTFVANVERGVEEDLLDERMTDGRFELDELADALVLDRDETFEYLSASTLTQ
ncbi:hypothetical protein DEQ92_21270, partial [Haloferax sp. Atlit-6N]